MLIPPARPAVRPPAAGDWRPRYAGLVPELVRPTMSVRASFLAGELASHAEDGVLPAWLDRAQADFASFVTACGQTREMWGVPATELWFVSGPVYLGTLLIRHRLTPELRQEGGHIGYSVVPEHRRRGHATAMLAGACALCREDGMTELLLTCQPGNVGSRRVIEANGGILADLAGGTCHYWIRL